ncbi:MAG: metallophosphoesterase family protein [Lachnospiraceae bacterium]|nr:metallophosphoesterase family protein [Lachnospiraceae bacterium]
MRFYIADLHFYHENLLNDMDHRGFESLEKMHEYMINQWNKRVNKRDEVIVLGDFSMGKPSETTEILCRLNGKIGLIEGNHDHRYLDDSKFDKSNFMWITPYKKMKDNKRSVILSHYPIMCYDGQFHKDKDGNPKTYMLYGHVHDTFDEYLINQFINETKSLKRPVKKEKDTINTPCQMINCFCMYSDYVPLTLDEWIKVDTVRRSMIKEEDYKEFANTVRPDIYMDGIDLTIRT